MGTSQILQRTLVKGLSTYFLGTRTPYEKLELERNIYYLLKNGISYWEIEKTLSQLGYSIIDIRKSFEDLTNINPKDFFDKEIKIFYDSPPEIPSLCPAWGKAKEGLPYNYYFVQPFGFLKIIPEIGHYALFGQKGDTRELIEVYPTFEKAKAALSELVEKVITFPSLPETLKEKKETPRISSVLEALKLYLSLPKELLRAPPEERINTLNSLLEQNRISKEVYEKIKSSLSGDENKIVFYKGPQRTLLFERNSKIYPFTLLPGRKGVVKKDKGETLLVQWIKASPTLYEMKRSEVEFEEKIAQEVPITPEAPPPVPEPKEEIPLSLTKEKKEISPKDFFEKIKKEFYPYSFAMFIKQCEDFIKEKFGKIQNINYTPISFKYLQKEQEFIKDFIQEDKDIKGVIAYVIEIEDLRTGIEKLALLVFFITEEGLVSVDSFKGEDEKVYPLTQEGVSLYLTKNQ